MFLCIGCIVNIYIYTHIIFVAVNMKNHNNESFTFTKWISKKWAPKRSAQLSHLPPLNRRLWHQQNGNLCWKFRSFFGSGNDFDPQKWVSKPEQKSEMNKRVVGICQDGVGYCWMIIKFFSIYTWTPAWDWFHPWIFWSSQSSKSPRFFACYCHRSRNSLVC